MSIFHLNRATLIGNVTRDPELKYLPNGTAMLKFGIATNESRKKEDGTWQEMTTFHNITVWGKGAERISKIVQKGKKMYIEGKIENKTYEKDGVKKFFTEINAMNVISFDRVVQDVEAAQTNDSLSDQVDPEDQVL